ncbi:hypothetical protein M2146_002551 [Lachnospiraceae bacterium PF1-22]
MNDLVIDNSQVIELEKKHKWEPLSNYMDNADIDALGFNRNIKVLMLENSNQQLSESYDETGCLCFIYKRRNKYIKFYESW